MVGLVHSAAPSGVAARPVEIEVNVSRGGQAKVVMAGLPDAAVRESRDRVKAAIVNSGYRFPGTRVTVNLAPAGLRKEGGAYDLPIAVAVLAAMGQISVPRAGDHLVVGELALDGRVRPVRGALCIADAAARLGSWRGLVLPRENAAEAALSRSVPVLPVERRTRTRPPLPTGRISGTCVGSPAPSAPRFSQLPAHTISFSAGPRAAARR
jgi:magnesium chelatase family protein